MVTDVTKRKDVEALRDAALAAFGKVDVWVNNAGRGITRFALELTDEDVDEMITVNLKSALYGMQVIAPISKSENRDTSSTCRRSWGAFPSRAFAACTARPKQR